MAINLWLKDSDKELFRELCDTKDVELSEYLDDILTGELKNAGILGGMGRKFVLGRKKIWIARYIEDGKVKYAEHKIPFVHIRKNSAYPTGLILTPNSWIDVKYHRGSRTIDELTDVTREELLGAEEDDFVKRIFKTYESPLITKINEKDDHLLVYFSDNRA